jgi:hypothetical protein
LPQLSQRGISFSFSSLFIQFASAIIYLRTLAN